MLSPSGSPAIEVGDTIGYRLITITDSYKAPTPTEPGGETVRSASPASSVFATLWSSSDPSVASVDATTGLVRAIKPGQTIITISDATGPLRTSTLTVIPVVATIRITANTAMPLAVGQSAVLTFTAYDANGVSVPGVPIIRRISNPALVVDGAPFASIASTPAFLAVTLAARGDGVFSVSRSYVHASPVVTDSLRFSSP